LRVAICLDVVCRVDKVLHTQTKPKSNSKVSHDGNVSAINPTRDEASRGPHILPGWQGCSRGRCPGAVPAWCRSVLSPWRRSTVCLPATQLLLLYSLVTGPRRSLSLKLSDKRVYEPQIRARLGTAAHFCEVVVLKMRAVCLSPTLLPALGFDLQICCLIAPSSSPPPDGP